jgi:NAD(P)-dependent dehydrogenase (short-subunit alcohol dehydrogenase family)
MDAARLDAASRELKTVGDFHPVIADLSQPVQAAILVAEVVSARWGSLDALVNNAATGCDSGGFVAGPVGDLQRVFDVNLSAPHHLIKALLPYLLMGREPRVVNVSSEAGQLACLLSERGDPNYCLSKYALNGLTLLWSRELRGRIAVNTIHPGWIRTDMGGPAAPDDLDVGGHRIVQALAKPFSETGRFWFGEKELPW